MLGVPHYSYPVKDPPNLIRNIKASMLWLLVPRKVPKVLEQRVFGPFGVVQIACRFPAAPHVAFSLYTLRLQVYK